MRHNELNKGWRFLLDDPVLAQEHNYWDKGYDDKEWGTVTIPHDWSVAYPFSEDYSSGTGYVTGGVGWYRLHFRLDENLRGKRIRVVFDGVYKNSQVWCNSYYLGKWPYGYTTFQYDITEQASYGDCENVLAVKVTHTDVADSRWFTGSGITRKVTLVIDEPVAIQPDSLFFQTPKVSAEEAEILITLNIEKSEQLLKPVTVKAVLKEVGHEEIALVLSQTVPMDEDSLAPAQLMGKIIAPKLWSATSPMLYDLSIYFEVEGDAYLVEQRRVGIRTFRFDPDEGFYINEENVKLKGVCLHHDAGCLGAAVAKNIWRRRLLKLKDMGCNAIRGSHNPHNVELYELCDEMGFYVIDEAFDEWEGPKNKWSTGHNVYPPKHQGYFEEFPQWHEKDLKAMVLRDRNYPSIIMWSIGNEIDYPNDPYCHPLFNTMTGNNDANKPSSERQYNPNKPNAERLSVLARRLVGIVKEVDQSRPVSLAAAYPELSTQIGFIDELDVVGYNYKEEYYVDDHKRFPLKPFLGSENGHSYEAWLAVRDNPYISGQFLWTGIDYLGEAYGWPIRGSGAGLLTTAGFEKDGFYYRKALWAEEPVIYLMTEEGRTWNYSENERVKVKVYSNCSKLAIHLNGTLLEEGVIDDMLGYYQLVIPYVAGALNAVGYENGQVVSSDKLETTEVQRLIDLKVWDQTYQFNGEDIIQVEVTLQDASGRPVPHASNKLHVEVRGSATLIGIENGDLADLTRYTANYRYTYNGHAIFYLRTSETAGPITITVTSPGLLTKELIL